MRRIFTLLLAASAALEQTQAAAAPLGAGGWTAAPESCAGLAPRPGTTNVVHYHLHKTGGISLNSILLDRFGGKQLHGPQRKGLTESLAASPHSFMVTYVREPVAALLSRFYFWRAQSSSSTFRLEPSKAAKVLCQPMDDYMAHKVPGFGASHNFMFASLAVGQPLDATKCAANETSATTAVDAATHTSSQRRRRARSRGVSGGEAAGDRDGGGGGGGGGGDSRYGQERVFRKPQNLTNGASWRDVCPGGTTNADLVHQRNIPSRALACWKSAHIMHLQIRASCTNRYCRCSCALLSVFTLLFHPLPLSPRVPSLRNQRRWRRSLKCYGGCGTASSWASRSASTSRSSSSASKRVPASASQTSTTAPKTSW